MRFVGGNDGRVFAINPGVRELGVFEWGRPPTKLCNELAKTLLTEVIGADRAARLYLRFRDHPFMVKEWSKPVWTFTDDDVTSVVKELDETTRGSQSLVQQMARERPVVIPAGPQLPGGTGFGSNDTAPDRRRK